jgi:hypothetical protein
MEFFKRRNNSSQSPTQEVWHSSDYNQGTQPIDYSNTKQKPYQFYEVQLEDANPVSPGFILSKSMLGKKKILLAVFCLVFLIWISTQIGSSIFISSNHTAEYFEKNTIILNVFNPKHPKQFFDPDALGLETSADWMKVQCKNGSSIESQTFRLGYFQSSIYNMAVSNISLSILEKIMKGVCGLECKCACSLQIGIPKNIILVNSQKVKEPLLMINPSITSESDSTIAVKYSHYPKSGWVTRPSFIFLEYNSASGSKENTFFEMEESACVYECIHKINQLCIPS